MRLQLQSLIFEKFGAGANDLADGDDGASGRAVRPRKAEPEGRKGKGKRGRNIVSLHGWEWDSEEEFVIDRLIGKMVADGGEVPGRSNVPAGTVLYKVLWEGFPPEHATWEDEENLPAALIEAFEEGLEEEEIEDGESDGEEE